MLWAYLNVCSTPDVVIIVHHVCLFLHALMVHVLDFGVSTEGVGGITASISFEILAIAPPTLLFPGIIF